MQRQFTPENQKPTGDDGIPNVPSPKRRPGGGTWALVVPSLIAAEPLKPEPASCAGAGVPEQTPERVTEPSAIVLELCGQGVLDVPLSQRRIGPISLTARSLLVGRKHQPDLHRHAVTTDCLQFLSRDHFRIAFEGGEFRLLALTSNPIWHDRDGVKPVELARGDLVTIAFGDRILLGTGGEASLAEDARRCLCWHFREAKQSDGIPQAAGTREQSPAKRECLSPPSPVRPRLQVPRVGGHGTPPSPGGPGPRVSIVAPWAEGLRKDSKGQSESFQPMLPPAAEVSCPHDLQRFGSGAASALRAPVLYDPTLESVRPGELGESRNLEFTERKDAFADSGFRF